MTDEQINIKIAEVCGWKPSDPKGKWCHPKNWALALNGAYEVWVGRDRLPNYCNDLNAMHEAEQQLSGFDEWMSYDKFLAELAEGFTWRATARQRAEAFLRTLNLWEE